MRTRGAAHDQHVGARQVKKVVPTAHLAEVEAGVLLALNAIDLDERRVRVRDVLRALVALDAALGVETAHLDLLVMRLTCRVVSSAPTCDAGARGKRSKEILRAAAVLCNRVICIR